MVRAFTRLPTIMEDENDTTATAPRPVGLVSSLVDPLDAAASAQHADAVLLCLADGRRAYQSKVIAWFLVAVHALSLTEHGARVVCRALQVAAGEDRERLIQELRGNAVELSEHKYGHQVLITLVEMMPLSLVGFVFVELTGHAVSAAQNRFAWQVLETLIMQHGSNRAMTQMIAELVHEARVLCVDFYGNRVLQKIVEYGAPGDRASILFHLLPDALALASRRGFAASVLQQTLACGDENNRHAIISALLNPTPALPLTEPTTPSMTASSLASLADVSCSKRGSALLVDLAGDSEVDQSFIDLQRQLLFVAPRLRLSKYGLRVARRYGLGGGDSVLSGHVHRVPEDAPPVAAPFSVQVEDAKVKESGLVGRPWPLPKLYVALLLARAGVEDLSFEYCRWQDMKSWQN